MKPFKPANKPTFYIKVPDAHGGMKKIATGLRADDPASYDENFTEAAAMSDAAWDAFRRLSAAHEEAKTVRGQGTKFIATRRTNGIRDVDNEEQRLRDHVFAYVDEETGLEFGSMRLDDVDGPYVVRWMDHLKTKLAPKTCHNVYSTLKTMWRKAVKNGVTKNNPCALDEDDLPEIEVNAEWRREAHYTHAELWELITNVKVPPDRRVQWALLGIAMLRDGELAGLRRNCVDLDRAPLGCILVRRSYDGPPKESVRELPIHPVLGAILEDWLRPGGGWAQMMGREIGPDDLVLPCPEPTNRGRRKPKGAMRDKNYIWKRIKSDLIILGLRHRRVHDLRRSGISRSLDDGADEKKLNWCTHKPPQNWNIMARYTTHDWEALCAEIEKLQLPPREKRVNKKRIELAELRVSSQRITVVK